MNAAANMQTATSDAKVNRMWVPKRKLGEVPTKAELDDLVEEVHHCNLRGPKDRLIEAQAQLIDALLIALEDATRRAVQ